MRKARIGIAQVTSTSDFDSNLKKAETFVKKASASGADIVALPENICYIGPEGTVTEFFKNGNDRKAIDFFSRIAAENKIHLLAGTIPVPVPNKSPKLYSRSLIFDPNGAVVHQYDKIHLFDVTVNNRTTYAESSTIEPGSVNGLQVVELPFAKVAMLICFDLRFPEAFYKLAQKGAEIIFLPAAFTEYTGQFHWEMLLRARAVDNQLFVAAPNQTGEHFPGRLSWGNSMVVDPWGSVIDSLKKEEGLLVTEIDLDDMYRKREQFPVLNAHRIL